MHLVQNRPGHAAVRDRSRRPARVVLSLAGVVLAVSLTACSSTTNSTSTSTTQPSTKGYVAPPIPSSAFSNYTGITNSTVTVGNVSTKLGGLFAGSPIGVQAYADYVNSSGGINGRKLVVGSQDDQYAGGPNKQFTAADVATDFALVGSFSLQDSFGGAVLAANPDVPNVTVSLDQATSDLPNTFSPSPAATGWQLGPLVYFKNKFPSEITHTAALIAGEPSAETKWAGEKAAMVSEGYRVVYDPTFAITTTNFNEYVASMKSEGVRILFLEQMPENYAASVIKALNQQNFHPTVVLGASTYSEQLVPNAGGPAAIDGAYMEQSTSLYLGEDATAIPAVGTFLHWVQVASPGWHADLYTFYGWLSAQLFVQALSAAGSHPSRGSVLAALRKITSFNGNHLNATADPAQKLPASCYIIARIEQGRYVRVDDPPTTPPSYGYRCDQPYYFYQG